MKGFFPPWPWSPCSASLTLRAEQGVLRPLPRPGYGGVQTLPAPLPADLRSSQTRPYGRPDVPSFQRPQIQPQHPSSFKQTKPLPRPVTLPAKLPQDLKQTRPVVRPQALPVVLPAGLSSPGKQTKPLPRPVTLPAKLPQDLKQTRPVVRPQAQALPVVLPAGISSPGKQTKPLPRPVTLPARLPEGHRQTRPVARPSYHRPQVLPAYPSGGRQTLPATLPEDLRGPSKQTRPVIRHTSGTCRNCVQLSYARRDLCCRRLNACC
ncbi:keratinocyte proline-rich protein-like [Penaeus indicus]|uniref:keratinocyte proline-rich protein-like n=1 Tax=Penaeus indicus TaxID=29960 RepID=UPI00300D643A